LSSSPQPPPTIEYSPFFLPGALPIFAVCALDKGRAQAIRQRDHGHDVFVIVVEDAAHGFSLAGPYIVGIELRDEMAGHVVFTAYEAQNALFQVDQPAALQPPPPELARRVQQIEVGAALV